MPRLFVAIAPPEPVRAELAALQENIDGFAWTRPEQIHLTLRFVGETTEDRQVEIEAALERVRVEPFVLPVAGTGAFPPRGRPKVVWAGTGHAHTRLFQLRQQVDDALLSVALDLDVRTFHPHFTLARIRENADERHLARFLKKNAGFEAPPFRVDKIRLYASELRSAGPIHTIVREYALTAPQPAR